MSGYNNTQNGNNTTHSQNSMSNTDINTTANSADVSPVINAPTKRIGSKKLLIAILVILALCIGTAAGYLISQKFIKDKNTATTQTETKPEPEFHGSVITVEANTENLTEEQINSVLALFRVHLDGIGYTEAYASHNDGTQFEIRIPELTGFSANELNTLLNTLLSIPELQFLNAQGEVVLTGADLENATAQYGQVHELSASEHYIELTLTPEGVEKFSEATKIAATAAEGQNYIAIMLDDTLLSCPRVDTQITEETCTISGDFTAETAKSLAESIRSSKLGFEFKITKLESFEH